MRRTLFGTVLYSALYMTLREKEKRWNENSLVIIIYSKLIRSLR